MNEEIKRQIEADVTSGETEVQKGFEKELENSAKESIKKLQRSTQQTIKSFSLGNLITSQFLPKKSKI